MGCVSAKYTGKIADYGVHDKGANKDLYLVLMDGQYVCLKESGKNNKLHDIYHAVNNVKARI